jgi:hypothetical protein
VEGVPDFDALKPIKTGTSTRIDLSPRARDRDYALEFFGLVNVPADGVYTLTTRSDNGSKLFIGNTEIVDNDSWRFRTMERCGSVALAAGCHPIKVQYFQTGGGASLEIYYQGPGVPRQQIPPVALYRQDNGSFEVRRP